MTVRFLYLHMYNIKERKKIQALKRVIRKYIKKHGQCSVSATNLAKQAKIDPHLMKELSLKLLETTPELVRYEEFDLKSPKLRYIYELSHKSRMEVGEYKSIKNISSTYTERIYEEIMRVNEVSSWNSLTRLELISSYFDAKIDIIPVDGKKRKFTDLEWDTTYKGNKDLVMNYFGLHPEMNVAARQQGEIGIVDVDDYSAMMKLLGGETFDTLIAKSGGGDKYHWWFRNPQGIPNALKCHNKTFDFITARNMYVVIPPSIHPDTKQPYTWEQLNPPIDLPDAIIELIESSRNQNTRTIVTQITDNRFKRAQRGRAQIKKELPAELLKGNRYDGLFNYGRSMYWIVGKPIEEVRHKLIELNNTICQPPLSVERMNKVLSDVQHGKHTPDFEAYLKKTGRIK
jgi:hypothetical protein